jgi:hypothetical protein
MIWVYASQIKIWSSLDPKDARATSGKCSGGLYFIRTIAVFGLRRACAGASKQAAFPSTK